MLTVEIDVKLGACAALAANRATRGQRIGWSWLVRPGDLDRFIEAKPERRKR